MPQQDEQEDLARIVAVLNQHGVEFIIIGGYAAQLHGGDHPTGDVDICYRRTYDNARRFAGALRDLNAKLRGLPEGLLAPIDAATITAGCNFTFETHICDLDALGEVVPIGSYEKLAQRAEAIALGSIPLTVIALEDLLAIKMYLGRDKDLRIVPELKTLLKLREQKKSNPSGQG